MTIILFRFSKNTQSYIKAEQFHREADFAKMFRNIVDFRVNVRIQVSSKKYPVKHFLRGKV